MSNRVEYVLAPAILLAALLLVATGCGEKIAIPQAEGLYSVKSYALRESYPVPDPRQLAIHDGVVYIIEGNRLARRDLDFEVLAAQPGLADPTALSVRDDLVFVWEDAAQQLSWFHTESLLPAGSRVLAGTGRVEAVAACDGGIEQVPGAITFLYLAVPDSGVVHRLVLEEFAGANAYGILSRSGGAGVRSVHRAAGMAVDLDDSLLVCDADSLRNWVIRFNAEPDPTDLASEPGEPDPLRGRAALFTAPACNPPAADEYTLGNAPSCGQTDWIPGPSDAPGLFDGPRAVAVDGSGRIFVADTGNQRIQVFQRTGEFDDFFFGDEEMTPRPVSLALFDFKEGIGKFHYAAWVFVVEPDLGVVRKFGSNEHLTYLARREHQE